MRTLLRVSLLLALTCFLGSCESSGYSTSVGVSYYQGGGWYDPYYGSRCCYTAVRPPIGRPGYPNRPVHLPSRPRPGVGGGGRPRPMPRRR